MPKPKKPQPTPSNPPDPTPVTNWKPQQRILAGGGLGLAIANIIAYYFEMPGQIEASVGVILTTLIAYFWKDL